MGLGILYSIVVGVWRKAPEAFPDSNTTLDTFQSLIKGQMLNFTLWMPKTDLPISQARTWPKAAPACPFFNPATFTGGKTLDRPEVLDP